jgi:hypothetical protein
LGDVQRLTLSQAGDNIHQHDVGITLLGNSLSAGGTDISGANDANLGRYL